MAFGYSAISRILSVLTILMMIGASSAMDVDADSLGKWLAMRPESRSEQRSDFIKECKKKMAIVMAIALEAEVSSDGNVLAKIDSAKARDPSVECWRRIIRSGLLVHANRAAESVQGLRQILGEAPTLRLRYEALMRLANALKMCGMDVECDAVRSEMSDLAKHELYADSGIDVSGVVPGPDDKIRELYELAVEEFRRGEYAKALQDFQLVARKNPHTTWETRALIGYGWCLVRVESIAKGEQVWRNIVIAAPDGPWTGQAQVALFESAFMERQDVDLSEKILGELIGSVDRNGRGGDESWKSLIRPVREYQVVFEVVRGNYERVKSLVHDLISEPGYGTVAESTVDGKVVPTGLGRLMEMILAGQILTPKEALTVGKSRANMQLLVADIWIEIERPGLARSILEQVVAVGSQATKNQQIYARMRLSDIAYGAEDYETFRLLLQGCIDDSPRNPWAGTMSMCLAADAYSRRGKEAEALGRLEKIRRDYPRERCAMSSLWYTAVIHLWGGRLTDAGSVFDELETRYPDNPWHDVITRTYRPWIKNAQKSKGDVK